MNQTAVGVAPAPPRPRLFERAGCIVESVWKSGWRKVRRVGRRVWPWRSRGETEEEAAAPSEDSETIDASAAAGDTPFDRIGARSHAERAEPRTTNETVETAHHDPIDPLSGV